MAFLRFIRLAKITCKRLEHFYRTTRTFAVLPCAFYDVCDFVSNLDAIDGRQEIVRQKNRKSDVNKA